MASRGVNKVILVGNLGGEPEVRYAASGTAIANVNIATSASWRDKQTGEQQESTEWHRVVFFGRTAEVVKEYLHKGSQVYIEGRLQTRKWQDKDGQDRWSTEVVANDMQMLGGRGGGSGTANFDQGGGAAPMAAAAPMAGPEASVPAPASGEEVPADEEFDDDIPF